MANTEIKIFDNVEFGKVRIIEENGKPLFCAADVAKALGYTNPNKAVNDHCRAITKRSTPISGKVQSINFIPEGDVYRLITHSKLSSAEKFEKWVFDEVLPDIRKHGVYMTDSMIAQVQQNPELIYIMADTLMKEHQKNQELTQSLEEAQPKVEFHDKVLMAPETLTITQIAKEYGKSGREMNALLHDIGIQYKVNGQWVLYAKYANQGYTKDVTCQKEHDGVIDTYVNTQWTHKGRKFLYKELKQRNILPIQQAV